MPTNKKLRTPIIKPRVQGGTFYTFGSAMEDIGLNINELNNKVELSHYVLLNIPKFDDKFVTHSITDFSLDASKNVGDYKFAEGFQNYVLNMETILRNQVNYNYASSLTVSERVFWKWLKPAMNMKQFGTTNYMYDSSIVQCFGVISAGAQRSDDYGLYNETFVQIPSSYSKTKVLFKHVEDGNLHAVPNGTYSSSNTNGFIENISMDELDNNYLIKTTGISGVGAFDNTDSSKYYTAEDNGDFLTVEFLLENLQQAFGDNTLTYDDIAMNNVAEEYQESVEDFNFNAILVYYSIYNSTGKSILATNAYGILLLDNTISDGNNKFIIPHLIKRKSTPTANGTSYSFRLNIKTSSAYSGDAHVTDNSCPSYEMSTDFNDVVRNLGTAIDVLKTNSAYLYQLASSTNSIKELAANAIDKVNDLEKTVNSIKLGDYFSTATVNNIYFKDSVKDNKLSNDVVSNLISAMSTTYDSDGKIGLSMNIESLTEDSYKIGSSLKLAKQSGDVSVTYNDMAAMLGIILQYVKNNI